VNPPSPRTYATCNKHPFSCRLPISSSVLNEALDGWDTNFDFEYDEDDDELTLAGLDPMDQLYGEYF